MDLDFFSQLLGGKGANPMTMLLPLLFGGKSTDFSSLFGSLFNKNSQSQAVEKGNYPPLFGSSTQVDTKKDGDILQLLGKILPTSGKEEKQNNDQPFPYELQYNRPEKQNKRMR